MRYADLFHIKREGEPGAGGGGAPEGAQNPSGSILGGNGAPTTTETPAAPTATSAPPADGSFDFRSMMPQDMASEPCLQDIPNYETFVKNYVHAQKAMGGMVKIPGEDSTPEDLASFHQKLGAPAELKGYDEVIPGQQWLEGTEPLREAALKAGVTVGQFKAMHEAYDGIMAARGTANANDSQAIMNELRSEWGADTDKQIGLAEQVVSTFGGEELLKSLDATGAGNNKELIRAFAAIGKSLASEGIIDGSPVGAITKESALQQAETLMADPAYMNGSAPNHKALVSEVSRLFAVAYPESREA